MVTKRQLGIAVICLSVLGIAGVMVVHVLGLGQWSGFGPLQRIGVGLASGALVVGCVLVSLGDRPA